MGVHYVIDQSTGKFRTMELIDPSTNVDLILRDLVDFEYPRSLKKRDKTGYKNFLFALKANLFRNSRERMTREKSEEFFNNDRNFV
jgi:hypothetical protein